ncbi:MAG: anthranilate phosphoribosyltransferase [Spirochaetia bacterium]|nr:anthranilate phosphoribosyltransferase [Spirochaetia bacterium]
MLKKFIQKVTKLQDLTFDEMSEAMDIITTGQTTDAQIAALLVALMMKGETVEEITAAAVIMREKAHKVRIEEDIILDTCGTGGDGYGTINISTAVSIIAAAAGVAVAKHGNRSVTSESGSADVLKALGVNIDIPHEKIKQCIETTKIGFFFAPACHVAMKYAGGVRKEIGVRTIFNVLGPIINPAGHTHHLMGVFSENLTEKIAGVLKNLGLKHFAVVCGKGNMDEITLFGPTKVTEVKDGETTTYYINPGDYGIKEAPMEAVKGGTPDVNARIMREIFDGTEKGPYRDVIVLNAGFALYIADKSATPAEGVELAKHIIDSGAAKEKLKQFIECTNS